MSDHPLRGQMHRLSEWQIKQKLADHRPTPVEARGLAFEESRRPMLLGGDRPEIYRALDRILKGEAP